MNAGIGRCRVDMGMHTVSKIAPAGPVAALLREQIAKQRAFKHSALRAPIVHGESTHSAGVCTVVMERVPGVHPLLHPQWRDAVRTLAQFVIDNVMAHPQIIPIGASVRVCAERVAARVHGSSFIRSSQARVVLAAVSAAVEATEGQHAPAGYAHGDLTLCNALVDITGQISVFDFYPPYMQSPLLDAVKLRQDTRFGWCTHFYDVPHVVMNEADKLLAAMFAVIPSFERLYAPLAMLDLARAVPYITDRRMLSRTVDELRGALQCLP